MNQSFRIPANRRAAVQVPIILLLQFPFMAGRYNDFRVELSIKSGWLFFTWVLIWIFWFSYAFRQFRSAQTISVQDGEIRFRKARGEWVGPPQTVATVNDDQIEFQLYSSKDVISLSKKKTPSELAQCLNERITADTRKRD